ncbi:flagellar assembly protein FliT [Anoxybacteroides amylolyticum]|uniref:Flagellar protein FliT n=1 Tax=Anoxybacteroides amylolyticum TaxID=294699 RepID=A0A160F772_9BACL|nr:flagellar assembly protein FliT [Anoxybacillus amylolyticus]ANB61915.1 flagellar FliT family protein [Anoxybacillus amylolyticus]
MSVVAELWNVTKELYALLEKPVVKEAREETIAAIEQLLKRRGELIEQLSPPYSEEEQQLGREMVALNQTIAQKLTQLKQQIQQDLKALKQKKKANQNYTNPYQEAFSMDGMFYDKKR